MKPAASPNSVFSVAYGPYEFVLDRRDLTVRLRSSADGALLVDGLPLGWIELEPGGRVPLGACRLMSLSEKMGHQGKRILFGLEAPGGVPVDVYVICGPKEVQITVEAARDTRSARVVGFGLMPGWCATGAAGELVVPWSGGVRVPATGGAAPGIFDVCLGDDGLALFGAFVGSVPSAGGPGLCLIHDSIHGRLRISEGESGKFACWEFARDSERRRLDMRVVVVPGADPVSIARAFRDNRIAERAHVTLRRKSRERSGILEALALGTEYAPGELDEVPPDRWDGLDRFGAVATAGASRERAPLATRFPGEWSAPWVERWVGDWARPATVLPKDWTRVPLMEVVWRDAVVSGVRIDTPGEFLDALLRLGWPEFGSTFPDVDQLRRLHGETVGAFVVGHERFGAPVGAECTSWSNGLRVWVNRCGEPVDCGDGRVLPPNGWRVDPAPSGLPPGGIASCWAEPRPHEPG